MDPVLFLQKQPFDYLMINCGFKSAETLFVLKDLLKKTHFLETKPQKNKNKQTSET